MPAREEVLQRVTITRTMTIRQRIVAIPAVSNMAAAAPGYFSNAPRYYNFVAPTNAHWPQRRHGSTSAATQLQPAR